ncbi:unnamed protein product, partial [Fusarium graminearum]
MNTKRAGDNKLALPALGYIKPDDDRGVVGTRSPFDDRFFRDNIGKNGYDR